MSTTQTQRRLKLVATGGSGPPLVLVHGFGSDRLSWLANQPALQVERSVYALDLPGHGAEALEERSLGEIAALVSTTIDDAKIGACDLVGHSLGGALCMMVAAERPDLVRSLVLIAPAGLGAGVDRDFLERFPHLADAQAAEALLTRLVSRPRLINRQMIAHVLAQLERPGRREALSGVADMLSADAEDIARAAKRVYDAGTPRLTVWGGVDGINPLDSNALEAFGGEVEILADAGHLPHVENAAAVNRRILSFVGGIM